MRHRAVIFEPGQEEKKILTKEQTVTKNTEYENQNRAIPTSTIEVDTAIQTLRYFFDSHEYNMVKVGMQIVGGIPIYTEKYGDLWRRYFLYVARDGEISKVCIGTFHLSDGKDGYGYSLSQFRKGYPDELSFFTEEESRKGGFRFNE